MVNEDVFIEDDKEDLRPFDEDSESEAEEEVEADGGSPEEMPV